MAKQRITFCRIFWTHTDIHFDGVCYGNMGCQVAKEGKQNQMIFLAKNQHAPRKLLYFDSVESLKIGHHLENKCFKTWTCQKGPIKKTVLQRILIKEKIDYFLHRKLT